jgi:hypothetical protein
VFPEGRNLPLIMKTLPPEILPARREEACSAEATILALQIESGLIIGMER